MNTPSSSSSVSSSPTSAPPKGTQTDNDPRELVTINEKVNLTKQQNEVLQMICNSYEMTISEYNTSGKMHVEGGRLIHCV